MQNRVYTLITGASEGLGKAFAFECAQRKMNLILVALPGPELRSLVNFIQKNYEVEVIGIEKDLSREENCVALINEINILNLQVNILINNVGVGGTFFFEKGNIQFYEKLIRLNVLATTLITRLLLDNLKKCEESYILNVGSMAGFFYLPKKHVYGASKAFIYSFSRSLQAELKKDNIHVTVLCPGGLNTSTSITLMNKTLKGLAKWSVMNPEDVAPIAINGLLKKKKVIVPGKINRFLLFLDKVIPSPIKQRMINNNMKKLDTENPMSRYLETKPTAVSLTESKT
jgi:short-subunit dehydrogenase